jgi:hypothetical protein
MSNLDVTGDITDWLAVMEEEYFLFLYFQITNASFHPTLKCEFEMKSLVRLAKFEGENASSAHKQGLKESTTFTEENARR